MKSENSGNNVHMKSLNVDYSLNQKEGENEKNRW